MFPKKVKFFRSIGPVTSKSTGKPFCMAMAEIDNPFPGGWRTLRITAMRAGSTPFDLGKEYDLIPSQFDLEKGTISMRVEG